MRVPCRLRRLRPDRKDHDREGRLHVGPPALLPETSATGILFVISQRNASKSAGDSLRERLLILGAQPRSLWGAAPAGIDQTLRASLQQHKIPPGGRHGLHVRKTTYSGAFGKRDSTSGVDVNADSMFGIASMTKPVTSVAAMQLVEQGKLKLDVPASTYLPELGKLDVLHGFDPKTGKPDLETGRPSPSRFGRC